MGTSSNETGDIDVRRHSICRRHSKTKTALRPRFGVVITLLFSSALTFAPSGFAQDTLDAIETNPDAPLAGAWKVRLDAPLLVVRNTSGELEGLKFESSSSSFGIPAGAGSLQLGYAVTSATNLGLNLGWSESETKVEVEMTEEPIEAKLSQYRLGLYGEHLFLGSGAVHPSLGAFGEILGGSSAGQDASGLGLGLNGALQIFIGNHASLDVNLRGQWVSLSVGDTDTTGFEFAGGLGFAVWLGGETEPPPTVSEPTPSFSGSNTSHTSATDSPPANTPTPPTDKRGDTATVQFSGGVTLTVAGTAKEPTFKLLVRGPSGECGAAVLMIGKRTETLEASPETLKFGSQDAYVYRGDLPAETLKQMARAAATTLVQVAVCGGTHQAGVFARQPLVEFIKASPSD